MSKKLPHKLKKEPLSDAIFELRFSSKSPASSILPGILFSALPEEKVIEQLPAAQFSKQFRDTDPNLQYAPVVRLIWKEFFILVSDRSLAVACKIPYPGWSEFKDAIIKVIKVLSDSSVIENIQRYSLKYVDLIPSNNLKEQVSFINFIARLGDHKLEKEVFQFRIEIPQDKYIHAILIVSSAVLTLNDGTKKEGIVIDIDSICNIDNQSFNDFNTGFNEKLDDIHLKNKEMFFECITPETLKYLEPIYE